MRTEIPIPEILPDDDGTLAITDRRQSLVAAAIQRGVCRLLRAHGFATVTELSLASGRRVDVMAINARGKVWVVEIKSCLADLRVDGKWPEYEEYCDRLYFAAPFAMPLGALPASAGVILADRWGAEIVRECSERILPAARRKSVTLRFARAAALRLQFLHDPGADGDGSL
jgi:hypothetical protein